MPTYQIEIPPGYPTFVTIVDGVITNVDSKSMWAKSFEGLTLLEAAARRDERFGMGLTVKLISQ